jgi:hypothetical protein
MGITIRTANDGDPVPRPIIVLLACDGADHGMFPTDAIFRHPDGFVGCHKMAMEAGWLERDGGPRGRLWLGPCCSGKIVRRETLELSR